MTNPANTATTLTVEEVRRVAELANLELTPDEQTRMQRDLSSILGYIGELQQLDTHSVEPFAQVGDLLRVGAPISSESTLRADEQRPSLDRSTVMAQAPETDLRFFKVPKVIER